jgi:hypothetical protein
LFRIVALNFDGTPAAESKALTLTFDGTTPPVENRALSEGSDAPLAPQAEAVDATQAPAEIVLVVTEVEPEFTWEGAPWAIEFAKMQKVILRSSRQDLSTSAFVFSGRRRSLLCLISPC